MSDTVVAPTAAPTTPTKKGKGAGRPKKTGGTSAKLASHPPATTMVVEAVGKLNEKGGSSLQAIKKFIAGFYNVDVEKQAVFIRKALKKQVEAGKLSQTKGSGASGSFKLAAKASTVAAKPKKVKAKAAGSPKKAKKVPASPKKKVATKAKKAVSPKVAATEKKPAAPKVKKASSPKKVKAASPKKAKPAAKTKKAPAAAKPKTPKKPKTMKAKATTAGKPKAGRKAAPKKQ